jgi:hypothetical protein
MLFVRFSTHVSRKRVLPLQLANVRYGEVGMASRTLLMGATPSPSQSRRHLRLVGAAAESTCGGISLMAKSRSPKTNGRSRRVADVTDRGLGPLSWGGKQTYRARGTHAVGRPTVVSGPEAGTFFSMSSPSSHRLLSPT